MVDYMKAAKVALGVTGISYGLGLIYAKFFPSGIGTLTYSAVDIPVRAQIQSGIDTTLAGKLLSYLGGVIPSGGIWGALIYLFVASFLVVLVAGIISEKLSFGKSPETRFAFGMAISSLVIGLLLGTMSPSIGSVGVGVAMLIYFGIIAILYNLARKIDAFRDILPVL